MVVKHFFQYTAFENTHHTHLTLALLFFLERMFSAKQGKIWLHQGAMKSEAATTLRPRDTTEFCLLELPLLSCWNLKSENVTVYQRKLCFHNAGKVKAICEFSTGNTNELLSFELYSVAEIHCNSPNSHSPLTNTFIHWLESTIYTHFAMLLGPCWCAVSKPFVGLEIKLLICWLTTTC